MEVDFERQRAWWDAKAASEDEASAEVAVNRALRWREIERHLPSSGRILEVGAATGAFSIPLARRGFDVTHLDLSPRMLDIAREKAGDLSNIRFVQANAVELPFEDCSFDVVLNMDGAVSFSGAEARGAVLESCRVARRTVIVTVSNRAWMIPAWMKTSISVAGRFLPAVQEMMENGRWHQEQFEENHLLAGGCTDGYLVSFKAFLPEELKTILQGAGMSVLRLGGLGSLANFCGKEVVDHAANDETLMQEFLDLCERYDADVLPDGPGTQARAGLIAVAVRE